MLQLLHEGLEGVIVQARFTGSAEPYPSHHYGRTASSLFNDQMMPSDEL